MLLHRGPSYLTFFTEKVKYIPPLAAQWGYLWRSWSLDAKHTSLTDSFLGIGTHKSPGFSHHNGGVRLVVGDGLPRYCPDTNAMPFHMRTWIGIRLGSREHKSSTDL